MKPEVYALFTAICWGVGGFLEQRGLQISHLTPQAGVIIRTAVAFIALAAFNARQFGSLSQLNGQSLLYIAIGGGLFATAGGGLLFYTALKGGQLGRVMPIAFTAPLFGALMGILFASEPITWRVGLGIGLTVAGIVLLSST